ncbi:MAG: FAD-dependent oxidoreductase [Burkholderiales bacterium]
MSRNRLLVAVLMAALIAAFFAFDLGQYIRLEYFKSQQAAIDGFYRANPLLAGGIFFAIYIAVAALSLPGAAVLTLFGGAIFGLVWGTVIVSFASTLGATLAFLSSRFLFRDAVQQRFGDRLKAVNAGFEKEGAFYLFTLRMIPLFPFFLVNLLMGLTPIGVWTYYWVSQVGMLAATMVFMNAGAQLAQVTTLSSVLSAKLLGSFILLGIFPLIAKRAVDFARARKALAKWPRPARFDRNLVVIGAGSAGLVSAYIAAAVRARVTLIEKHKMGGDCLNTGCVPSKALIKSARVIAQMKRAREFGLKPVNVEFDFADIMERVQRVVKAVEPHDSVERYTRLGVECMQGEAKITSPWTVEIKREGGGAQMLTTRAIVIAAGARPFVPPIPGIEEVGYLTSDTVWNLRALPKRLVVLGGGPIGCELAQCFARFGSQVTQVEMLPRILVREDPEISDRVARQFRDEGIDVRVEHKAKQLLREDGEKILVCEHEGSDVRIPFDELLCAVGRIANTSGYGLEELGIGTTRARTVDINEYLQTIYPNIYACGDVAGPYQFTHTASHQAWYAAVNALFGGLRKFRVDYSVIPAATFTDPEVARVGLNETEAREKNIPFEVTTYGIDDLDRAIADGEAHGVVKILTVPGRDRILGATIVGEHAGDLIVEFIVAMKHGIGLNKILATIHIYPTFAEANKYAAGNWKKAHAPQRLLAMAEKFHAWMRG